MMFWMVFAVLNVIFCAFTAGKARAAGSYGYLALDLIFAALWTYIFYSEFKTWRKKREVQN